MGDSSEIRRLVAESDEFEQCDDCGRCLAGTSNHRCESDERRWGPPASDSPNRDERHRRARSDTRHDDTLVCVFGSNCSTTYAYHDLTSGEPRCGCHRRVDDELEVLTLVRAKARGRSPCGRCRRLR